MNGDFRRSRHKYLVTISIRWSSTLRYPLLVRLLRDSTFPQVLEDFFKVPMIGDLHVVEVELRPSGLDIFTSL